MGHRLVSWWSTTPLPSPAGQISAKDGGWDDSLGRGEVVGARISAKEMAALRHVMTQQTLPPHTLARRALIRALNRLDAGGALPSAEETGWAERGTWAAPPTAPDRGVPTYVYIRVLLLRRVPHGRGR